MIDIDVDGVTYPVPSSAADTNWAAQQIAFEQALAEAVNDALSGASNAVLLTGNQTVAGNKNFTGTTTTDVLNIGDTASFLGQAKVGQTDGIGVDAISTDTSGTPGNVADVTTMRGRAAIALGQASVVFTGMTAMGATAQVLVTMESNDATAKYLRVTGITNSGFTVSANANAAADCVFSWLIFGSIQ